MISSSAKSANPVLDTLATSSASRIPTPMPPARASGSERSRPTRAAASARTSRPGPSASTGVPVSVPRSGLIRTTVRAARTPASTQTRVEIRRGLIPASAAASGFSADARIAMPQGVRVRNSPRTTTTAGTTARTVKCSPRSSRLPNITCRSSRVG